MSKGEKHSPRIYRDPGVKCPFFKSRGRADVRCEGLLSGTVTEVRFRNATDWDAHLQTRCRAGYYHCGVYAAIDRSKRKE